MLVLNFPTSAAGSIRVETQDPSGSPVDGYAIEECLEIYGDEIQREVTWQSGSSVQELAGRTIRLKISVRDSDLYSLQFQ